MAAFLDVCDIAKAYDGNAVLRSISFAAEAGEYVTILGASGSGKSTLIRILAGFETPDGGDVLVNGRSLLPVEAYRRGIGFVFQGFALFPHLSVFDNVAFGLANRAGPIADRREIARRVEAMMALVGLAGLGGRRRRPPAGHARGRAVPRRAAGRARCEPARPHDDRAAPHPRRSRLHLRPRDRQRAGSDRHGNARRHAGRWPDRPV